MTWPKILLSLIVLCGCAGVSHAQHEHHGEQSHGMQFDKAGMVMNANTDVLPQNCAAISEDVTWEVSAGTQYAVTEAGRIFGYSEYAFHAAPCSRITVHFSNEDAVRHQWMVHGLPRYLYPEGMFHLEANGGEKVQGSFIVPGDDATYLVHCDITQHMEKGMKAQLTVGKGSGDLWSVPGVSSDFKITAKMPFGAYLWVLLSALLGLPFLIRALNGKKHDT